MMGVALVSKETYCKRDLRKCQKRPTQVSKETYCKRDLRKCQRDLQHRPQFTNSKIEVYKSFQKYKFINHWSTNCFVQSTLAPHVLLTH
jgi:hypothetical protein